MKHFFPRPALHRVQCLSDLVRACGQLDAPVVLNHRLGTDDLLKLGFLIGRNVQTSEAFGEVRAITHASGTRSIAKSLAAHPMHTDGTFLAHPPTYFLLYFMRADSGGGGISEFLPVSDLLGALEARWFKVFVDRPVRFERRDDEGRVDSWEGMLLGHDNTGRLAFRWRHDREVKPKPVTDGDVELLTGIERIRELVKRLPRLSYAAKEGDLICVPNRTWLHGRTALNAGSDRLVLRVWIQ